MRIAKEEITGAWSNGSTVTAGDRRWRVGRMSYGDFFLEPAELAPLGEREGFATGTLWGELKKEDNNAQYFEFEAGDF